MRITQEFPLFADMEVEPPFIEAETHDPAIQIMAAGVRLERSVCRYRGVPEPGTRQSGISATALVDLFTCGLRIRRLARHHSFHSGHSRRTAGAEFTIHRRTRSCRPQQGGRREHRRAREKCILLDGPVRHDSLLCAVPHGTVCSSR